MTKGTVTALVGAQHGSEGKGVVARYLDKEFDIAVRTGGPNAGHSLVYEGELYKMQSLPCGWTNPDTTLMIGIGAVLNVKTLLREIKMVKKAMPYIDERLIIDGGAGILEERHHEEEGGIDGELHKTMGSTGEGVGAARRDRLVRDPERFRLARDVKELQKYVREDTAQFLNKEVRAGKRLLLEGTQGCGLSLIHGSWPHVTTADTNAAQLAADAGVPPSWVNQTILVARTYPIRVAGPSGPMAKEISWEEMSARVGKEVVEKTTVTKKVRRIGEWDEPLMKQAVAINDPTYVALTFMDYLSPKDENKTEFDQLSGKAHDFIHYLERTFGVFVGLIGTGWDPAVGWVCVDRRNGN